MGANLPTYHSYWFQPEAIWVSFKITTAHPAPSVAVIGVAGELDIATCPQFDVNLDHELHDQSTAELIIDFTRLKFLAVCGLNSVMRANEDARAASINLQVVIMRPVMSRMFTLVKAYDHMNIQTDLDAARSAAGVGVTG